MIGIVNDERVFSVQLEMQLMQESMQLKPRDRSVQSPDMPAKK